MMAEKKPVSEIRLNAAVRVINSACEIKKEQRAAKKRYDRIKKKQRRREWWRQNKEFVIEYGVIFGCLLACLCVVYFIRFYPGS